MNNLHGYNDFRDKRSNKLNEDVEESIVEVEEEEEEEEETVESTEEEQLIESAQLYDSTWKVRSRIEIPVTLINAFTKKVQSETGEDPRKKWSEQELAEEMAKYVITSFLNIENLPVSIITGEQPQAQAQISQEMPAQTQVQPEEQQEVSMQIEPEPAQGSQEIAQTIPQTEEGI